MILLLCVDGEKSGGKCNTGAPLVKEKSGGIFRPQHASDTQVMCLQMLVFQ